MPWRIGRPGLLGAAARTAVIAGTAAATAGAVRSRQARRYQEQTAAQQYEAEQMAAAQQAAPVAAASAPGDDLVSKLKQLADLHAAGALTDAEFQAAKAKLVG